jgi:rhodanese-related sulfurtransferase
MLKPKEAISIIKNDTNITILDVRTPKEYRSGHIKNSILVPLDSLEENLDKIPKDKKIIVYCRSGNRSINASRVLKKHGYTPIDVKGGIIGLVSNGMKIER